MTNPFTPSTQKMNELERRAFVRRAAQLCLGVGIVPILGDRALGAPASGGAGLPRGKAERAIYLYMSGGMSHLDTFDLKPGADVQGPTEAVGTKITGYKVSKNLARTAQHLDKVAVINSLHTTQGAHDQGNYFMHTAYLRRGTITHPAMGSWMLKIKGRQNETLPGNVLVNGGSAAATSGWMESKYAPLPIGNPAGGLPGSQLPWSMDEFYKRLQIANAYDKPFRRHFEQKQVRAYTDLYREAINLMTGKDIEAFDIAKESPETRARYGENRFGQGVLLARRLVENNVRFVEVDMGGWDTHAGNFDAMDQRVPQLDMALSALLEDLRSKGLLDTTLVVLTTEFGRTPRINSRTGRDHHPLAFSGLLAGGGIRGGMVYGKSDSNAHRVEDAGVSVPDFNATIGHALGLDTEKRYFSRSGRPFTVGDKGQPIKDFF